MFKNLIKFLLVSTLAVFSFGQPGTLTDKIYWESKPVAVRNLAQLPPDQRESQAQLLDGQGYTIDRAIMIWGWDPTLVMGYRAQLGFKWLPNAYQPNFDSLQSQGPPWPNSIKVSTDKRDYPPYPTIVGASSTTSVAVVQKVVGQYIGNGIYEALRYQNNGSFLYQDGQVVTQDGVKYKFNRLDGAFGPSVWFTKVP